MQTSENIIDKEINVVCSFGDECWTL